MVRRLKRNRAYGIDNPLQAGAPIPIVTDRDPTANDLAEIGTTWVNTANDSVWVLSSITANSANWATSPASGVGVFASVDINPGDLHLMGVGGDILVDSGNLTLTAGNATIGGDLTVTGVTTITGDLDLSSAALIDLTSTLNASPAILLHANGGVLESIDLHADQGTAVDSISLLSDVGGITIDAGLATADAINIIAPSGGVDIDAALLLSLTSTRNDPQAILMQATLGGIDILASGAAAGEDIDIVATGSSVNINSTENVADSIVISSTNGGIDILALGAVAGEDIDIVATGSSVNITSTEDAAQAVYIRANGGTSETVQIHADQGTGVASINVLSDVGGITLRATGLATADAINLEAAAGGIDMDSALQTNIASSQAAVANAIRIVASAADGGIDVDAGTGGITIDSTGAVSIQGGAASDFSVGGAGIDLSLVSAAGRVVVNGEEAAADAVRILSAAGGLDANVALQMNLDSSQAAAADSIRIVASAADGGIDIDSGTGGITIDSTGAFSIDGAAASNITTTGAGIDLTLSSVLGSVLISSTENAANAIRLHANGGVTETIQLHADQGTAVNSIDILSDVGGITLTATGLASADAINLVATAGGVDVDGALQVNIASSQAAADALRFVASNAAGGIDIDSGTGGVAIDSTAAFSIDGATASNVTVTGASQDLTLSASGGSVNVTATEAAADAIVLNASNAAGGIDLLTGGGEISISSSGNVTMVPGTATSGAGVATVVINARVGVATFTGFTTAAGANEDFTITNSALGAGDGVFVTVSNLGTNDADMTLEGVITQTAGSLVVHTQNNGPAALNGNVVITFWIIN